MVIRKKIVLLGDSAVGKTSLIRRFVFDQFEFSYVSTVGSKVTKKKLLIPSQKSKELIFMIWDIIGREGYHATHARTFVGVHGAILVADLTRKETLENLEKYWIPFLLKVVDHVPMVFVCNKSDLKDDHQFKPDELKDLAKMYESPAVETLDRGMAPTYSTSAKDGTNVEKTFEALGHLLLEDKQPKDKVKKVCEMLKATGIRRESDMTKPIGALDAIIVDFCDGFSDSKVAMIILRQEIARAGIDINNPMKERVFKVVEYLAEAENEFKDEETVISNFKRRKEWVSNIIVNK
jgi:small GTP-binding protein